MDLNQELNRVADAYRTQGYDVIVRPSPQQLPRFAVDFRVEIVGRRGAEGVLVAVRKNRDELAADGEMQRYAEVTGLQPGWRFDLAVLEGENPKSRELNGAQEFSGHDIAQSLAQAGELSRMGFTTYAVIAAWAAFEAGMRRWLRASGQEAGLGSMPRQMLKEIYSAGALSPEEFRGLERASQLRNRIVHGFVSPAAETGDSEAAVVQLLSEVARRLTHESMLVKQTA